MLKMLRSLMAELLPGWIKARALQGRNAAGEKARRQVPGLRR